MINLNIIDSVVDKICSQIQKDIFTAIEINDIYSKLYPYTQLGNEIKEQHIENLKKDPHFL